MPRLRTTNPSHPGWTRRRRGTGYSLLNESGGAVTSPYERERVDALAIPPAWTDVWISPHRNGHIQACGTDASGRRQYIYHEQWQRSRARAKYDRALELAERLPRARAQVTRDLRGEPGTRDRALAVAFRLLDSAYLRVGSERYAQLHGSKGLTTLEGSDAHVSADTVVLEFVGKSAMDWSSRTEDPDLAAAIRSLKTRGPHSRLLAWKDGNRWRALRPEEVNDYVRARTGGDFTAKDFRTLHGTIIAARELAALGTQPKAAATKRAINEAVRATAHLLGNTPAVARSTYIDPRVIDRFRSGALLRTGSVSPERAIRELLLGTP
ncbi:DNA topoisomerase [Salinibacterium hongtaonis]|nr:DNA topoisomerase [Salinibacterium hongtaonis]